MLGFFEGADGFVGDRAGAALHAVVYAVIADGAEGFIVMDVDAQGGAQLFIEAAQIGELVDADGEFLALVIQEKFLVAGVPEVGELPIEHDGGRDGHLVIALRRLAEFGAAAIIFDARHAARTAHTKALGREGFDLLLGEASIDVPHGDSGYEFYRASVKVKVSWQTRDESPAGVIVIGGNKSPFGFCRLRYWLGAADTRAIAWGRPLGRDAKPCHSNSPAELARKR